MQARCSFTQGSSLKILGVLTPHVGVSVKPKKKGKVDLSSSTHGNAVIRNFKWKKTESNENAPSMVDQAEKATLDTSVNSQWAEQVSIDELLNALTGLEDKSEAGENVATKKQSRNDEIFSVVSTVNDLDSNEKGNVGDPLGRKFLGKQGVLWIQKGFCSFAAELVRIEAEENFPTTNSDFLERAKFHLEKNKMPVGTEDKCRTAINHYPTMWDNVQRSVRSALQDLEVEGKVRNWNEHPVWLLVKKLSKTEDHRRATRESVNKGQMLSTEAATDMAQLRINEYVSKALNLLKLEREQELSASQKAITKFGYKKSRTVSELASNVEELEKEKSGVVKSLTAISFSTGIRGTALVTLKTSANKRLPVGVLDAGELVSLKAEGPRGAAANLQVHGTIQTISDDSTSLVISVEGKYAMNISKILGQPLRLEKVNDMADITTFKRNCDALEKLQKAGLLRKNPSFKIVATLFGPTYSATSVKIVDAADHAMSHVIPPILSPEDTDIVADDVNSLVTKTAEKYSKLNAGKKSQRSVAIETALSGKHTVAVIQGPPGTGKTDVLREVILGSVKAGIRILAVAPTNAAVDNLVEKICTDSSVSCVRVGNPARVSPTVTDVSLDILCEKHLSGFREEIARRRSYLKNDLRQVAGDPAMETGIKEMLKQLQRTLKTRERKVVELVVKSAQVVFCTLVGAGDPVVAKSGPFDLCVFDEAGQATEPASWIPLLQAKRAVLAGDICQLAPTVMSQEALVGGLGISLMERYINSLSAGSSRDGAFQSAPGSDDASGSPYVFLDVQYRMNSIISNWCSEEMYAGRLQSAAPVRSRRLIDDKMVKSTWQTRNAMIVLDTRLPRGALLPGCEEQTDTSEYATGSLMNEGEADIVCRHVADLIAAGVQPSAIAVQSPYLAQVQLIQSKLESITGGCLVPVASVDSFQGREAQAVVISLVRSNATGTVGFLGDRRRMNVAISRAKCHVAIVCDSATVSQNPFLRRLLQHVKRNGFWKSANDVIQTE